jgi:hypothetical protein
MRPGGSEETTAGWSRVLSDLSMAATIARGASESIGEVNTRAASAPQAAQRTCGAAILIGRLTSKSPSCAQRYW